MKGNCCEAQTVYHNEQDKYNEINPYFMETINELEPIIKSIPQYKNHNHSMLVNSLHKQKLQFEDSYFPPQYALGAEFPFQPKWKRISEVYPGCKICENNRYTFLYMRNEHSFAKENFVTAME